MNGARAAILLALTLVSCVGQTAPTRTDSKLIPFAAVTQTLGFESRDGARLAGQIDLPPVLTEPPLAFIIHHSGAVDRAAYQYLAARLVPAGYAVFRFDKRGTGKSGGAYGCCEDEDALAAYRAVMASGKTWRRVFIIAQSVGTKILAQRWGEFEKIRRPDGVVLLSNLLANDQVVAINVPLHIIVSGSEPNLPAIGAGATAAHLAAYPELDASFAVIPQTEHTLFDVSAGPMDWSDPNWSLRFHPAAWQSLRDWLDRHS